MSLAFGLAAPDAQAGTYSAPIYSGGTYTVLGPTGQPTPFPYAPGTSKIGSTNVTGYGGDSGGPVVACTGPITVKFNWQPDKSLPSDPPPATVIVTESCSVSVSASASGASASYDTGLGKSGTINYVQGGTNTVTATSVRYTTPAGQATLTLPVVNASATGTNSSCSSSLRYSASVSFFPPVYVKLTGQNPTYQALTGQQITGTLIGVPAGAKVTKYTWSFSGGSPIKTWDPNAPGDGTPTQLVPFASTDLTKTDTTGNGISVSPINFYDQMPDTITAQCAVSFKYPDGTTPTVNAPAIPVTFMKPTLPTWNIIGGWVQH